VTAGSGYPGAPEIWHRRIDADEVAINSPAVVGAAFAAASWEPIDARDVASRCAGLGRVVQHGGLSGPSDATRRIGASAASRTYDDRSRHMHK
jgi:hypothetical protein